MNQAPQDLKAASKAATLWGILTIVLGVVAMSAPLVTGIYFAILIGIALIVAGLSQTIYAFQAGSLGRGIVRLLFGGITIVAGAAIVGQPQIALVTLTLFLAVYFVVDGISMSFASASMPAGKARSWVLINSLLTLMLGVLIWSGWPLSGVWAIGVLVGIRLIFSGMTVMAIGSHARAAE